MQIARQGYRIETAENALIFFKNGAPAYITKRMHQFSLLADHAGISHASFKAIKQHMLSASDHVHGLTFASYLDQTTERNYSQSYQERLRQLQKS